MRLSAGRRSALLTYCTNVHPADDVAELIDALDETTAGVARAVAPDAPFGLGIRLGEDQARELTTNADVRARFDDLLARRRFFVFTINGFPQARFHERRVKEAVYRPNWTDPARTRYTLDLARLLAAWLPGDDRFGTISTVPVGWRADVSDSLDRAAIEIWNLVLSLARLESETGAHIMVCLEPEPGCAIETISELIAFFETTLLDRPRSFAGIEGPRAEQVLRRHLGVCYDACHQAVLFADAAADLSALKKSGISIGKVQISNALRVPFDGPSGLAPLLAFDEERFLHQVAVRRRGGAPDLRFRDLPDLAAAVSRGDLEGPGEARCHFHVPVYAGAFSPLETTREDLSSTIEAILRSSPVRHFEVETYTFHVLPALLRTGSLEAQLVREIEFARRELSRC